MGGFLEGLGMQAAGQAVSFGIEQAGNAINAKRNYKYQKKINNQNAELAYDLWEKTWNKSSPAEQMARLKEAGLNPGLIYGGSGAGGATPTAQTGAGSSGAGSQSNNAGNGMSLIIPQQKAAIDQMTAQTEKIKAETEKLKGPDTQAVQGAIAKLAAETANEQTKNDLLQIQKRMDEVRADIAEQTEWTIIRTAEEALSKLASEAAVATGTQAELIKQAQTETQAQTLGLLAIKKGLIKTDAEIGQLQKTTSKITTDINNSLEQMKLNWHDLDVKRKNTLIQEALQRNNDTMTEFNTNWGAHVRQWSGLVGDVMSLVSKKGK